MAILLALTIGLQPGLALSPPTWWAEKNVLNTQQADDYAAANVGQLKTIARKAAEQLTTVRGSSTAAGIQTMIQSWNGTGEDYLAVTVGEVKSVAKKFYDALGLPVPWTPATTGDDDDFAIANIGQIKTAFAFAITPALEITTSSLANAVVGTAYNAQVQAAGGTPPYVYSVETGSLPAFLSLSTATGIISGTPSLAGTSSFSLRAMDSAGAVARKDFVMTTQATDVPPLGSLPIGTPPTGTPPTGIPPIGTPPIGTPPKVNRPIPPFDFPQIEESDRYSYASFGGSSGNNSFSGNVKRNVNAGVWPYATETIYTAPSGTTTDLTSTVNSTYASTVFKYRPMLSTTQSYFYSIEGSYLASSSTSNNGGHSKYAYHDGSSCRFVTTSGTGVDSGLTFAVAVYQGSQTFRPIPLPRADRQARGYVYLQGDRTTWSADLDPYCSLVADALVVEPKESSVPGPSGKGYCVVVGEAAQININDTATFGDDLIQKGDLTSTPAFKPWIPCTVGLRHAFTNTSPNSSNTDSRVTITSKGDTLQFHKAPIVANDPDETTPGNQSIALSFAQGRTERFWILAVADPASGDKHTLEIRYGGDSSGPILIEQPVVPLEFITPAGDPVNAPVEAPIPPGVGPPAAIPDGANEFTFSPATTGVLTMKLKAKVTGIGSMSAADHAKFTFEIDTIGNSTFTWDGLNPGGKATVSGDFITATATYTGLPQNNTDFGLKKARVKHGGNNVGESKFEVFFLRDAKNHPGQGAGTDPNWYHYWGLTTAKFGTHKYQQGAGTGYTNFVLGSWKAFLQDGITGHTAGGTWNNAEGIDLYANLARHEDTHRTQMIAIWGASSGRVPSDDVDGDWLKDSIEATLVSGHPYIPTNRATYLDTFKYNPSGGYLFDPEDYCLRQQPAWANGAANSEDWSNPGMQHKTLNDSDD